MGDTGLEAKNVTACKNKDLQHIVKSGDAESGAVGDQSTTLDPELHILVEAWPKLPQAVREGILTMVSASGGI